MTAWKWRTFQTEVIEEILAGDGSALIALPTGAGKTAIALEVARRRGARRVLIVAPVNTFYGWERHAQMFLPDLPFTRITSDDVDVRQDGVFIVGWEYNRRFDWTKVKLDAVIVDESARMGSLKAAQSSQTEAVWTTMKAPTKLCLSATPAGGKLIRLWSTLHYLWPQRFKYFSPWAEAHLGKKKDDFGWGYGSSEKQRGTIIRGIPTYVRREEGEVHSQLPGVVVHEIRVDLSPRQRKIYDQFAKDGMAWLEENPVAAALPATKYIRLLQTTLAVPTVVKPDDPELAKNMDTWEVTFAPNAGSTKVDALIDLVWDLPEDETVLVWTHSKKAVPMIAERLRKAKLGKVAVAHGGQSKTDREQAIRGMGVDHRFLVATIAALGEGVDGLDRVCSTEVWLSSSDRLDHNKQAEGRLKRPGQTRTINRYMILADATVETKQVARITAGRSSLESAGMM